MKVYRVDRGRMVRDPELAIEIATEIVQQKVEKLGWADTTIGVDIPKPEDKDQSILVHATDKAQVPVANVVIDILELEDEEHPNKRWQRQHRTMIARITEERKMELRAKTLQVIVNYDKIYQRAPLSRLISIGEWDGESLEQMLNAINRNAKTPGVYIHVCEVSPSYDDYGVSYQREEAYVDSIMAEYGLVSGRQLSQYVGGGVTQTRWVITDHNDPAWSREGECLLFIPLEPDQILTIGPDNGECRVSKGGSMISRPFTFGVAAAAFAKLHKVEPGTMAFIEALDRELNDVKSRSEQWNSGECRAERHAACLYAGNRDAFFQDNDYVNSQFSKERRELEDIRTWLMGNCPLLWAKYEEKKLVGKEG